MLWILKKILTLQQSLHFTVGYKGHFVDKYSTLMLGLCFLFQKQMKQ